jgi:serpin B
MFHTLRTLLGTAIVLGYFAMNTSAQPVKDADTQKLIAGNTAFALSLYEQVARKDGNLFLSPYSISSALGMTYAGARGKTAAEMKDVLHFHLDADKLHPAFGKLITQLDDKQTKRFAQLRVANRLWGQRDYGFMPDFLKLTATDYHAGLEEVDFVKNPEGSRETINAWVEKQTQDKIKDLLPAGIVTSNTRLVLTNAIYFKAAWMHPFSDKSTKPGDFTLADGKKVQVPLMQGNLRARFGQHEDFAMLELPYERQELSMLVVLPKDAAGLPLVEKQLSEPKLKQWLGTLAVHQVDTTLPKFKITAQLMLNDTLQM